MLDQGEDIALGRGLGIPPPPTLVGDDQDLTLTAAILQGAAGALPRIQLPRLAHVLPVRPRSSLCRGTGRVRGRSAWRDAPGSAAIGLLAGRSPSLQSNPFATRRPRSGRGARRRPLWRRPRSGFPCSLTGASGSGGFVAFALSFSGLCRGSLRTAPPPRSSCRGSVRSPLETALPEVRAVSSSSTPRPSASWGQVQVAAEVHLKEDRPLVRQGDVPGLGSDARERPRRPHEPGHRAGTNAEPRTRSPARPVSGWASSRRIVDPVPRTTPAMRPQETSTAPSMFPARQ